MQADTYGLYFYDSSNITLDRVVHLIGIDVVRSQLEQIDRDHENNGLDIMDAHRWLMMYNNTYFNAKVILSLLPLNIGIARQDLQANLRVGLCYYEQNNRDR